MEDKKVKSGSVAIGICLFVIAVLLILIVLFFYNAKIEKNNLHDKINELEIKLEEKGIQNSNSVNDSDNKLKIPSVYVADTKNLVEWGNYDLNVNDEDYSISIRNNKIMFTCSKDKEELKNIAEFFEISEKDIKVEPHKSIEVTGFSKKVVDVEIGCMGQGAWADIFIFIMEDGSVEYSNVKNMLTNVSSKGKINGLENIVRVQNVDGWDPEGGGALSILAIDKDNVCYDIADYIENVEDIILEGDYAIEASDVFYEFFEDGKVESSGNVHVNEGIYYTIGENKIELKFTKNTTYEDDLDKPIVKNINEIYTATIKDENTLLIEGEANGEKYEYEIVKFVKNN